MGAATVLRRDIQEPKAPGLKIARIDEAADDAEQAAKALEAINLDQLSTHLLREGLRIPAECLYPDRIRESLAHDRAHSLRDFAAYLTTNRVVSLSILDQALNWARLPNKLKESTVHAADLRLKLLQVADALPGMATTTVATADLTVKQQIKSWLEQLPKLQETSVDEFSGYKTFGAYLDRGEKVGKVSLSAEWESQINRRLQDSDDSVLNAASEQLLFKNLQFAVYKFTNKAEKALTGNPNKATLNALAPMYEQVTQLRGQAVQSNIALVLAMLKRCRLNSLDNDELNSEGNAALLRAVDTFDPWRGFRFSTYACRAILKSFSRVGIKLSKYQALQRSGMSGNFDELNEARVDSESVDGSLAQQAAIISSVRQAIPLAGLSDIEIRVLNMRIGLDQREEVMTLEEAGRKIGVTKERVRQIQNRAFAKIRLAYEEKFLN